jgi:hypothetical protein
LARVSQSESTQNFKVDRIIRDTGDIITLVVGNNVDATFKDLTSHERIVNALGKIREKAWSDVLGCIDAQAVDGICLDRVLGPLN